MARSRAAAPPGAQHARPDDPQTVIARLEASLREAERQQAELLIENGAVRVDGTDLRDVQLRSYRRQLGVVLQDPFLFSATVRENIGFARPDATDAQVIAATARHIADVRVSDEGREGIAAFLGKRMLPDASLMARGVADDGVKFSAGAGALDLDHLGAEPGQCLRA